MDTLSIYFGNLGRTLFLLRDLRGKSQAEVARSAGIGKSQLSKYENGKELPKLDSLERVLVALDIGYVEFFQTLALIDRRARTLGEQAASDKAADLIARAVARLKEVAADLTSALNGLQNNPGSVVVRVRTLHPNTFRFRRPLDVLVEFDGPGFVAHLIDVKLSAKGDTRQEAVMNLRKLIVETFRNLLRVERERWTEELQAKSALLDLVIEMQGREGARRS